MGMATNESHEHITTDPEFHVVIDNAMMKLKTLKNKLIDRTREQIDQKLDDSYESPTR